MSPKNGHLPKTSHGLRPKGSGSGEGTQPLQINYGSAANNQLALNDYLELDKSSDYKMVKSPIQGRRGRRQIMTKSHAAQASATEHSRTNTLDMLSNNIQQSKYITDKDRENEAFLQHKE